MDGEDQGIGSRAHGPESKGDWGMQFYEEVKWCKCCRKYVNYLLSLKSSYCVNCGKEVTLFNETDLKNFKKTIKT